MYLRCLANSRLDQTSIWVAEELKGIGTGTHWDRNGLIVVLRRSLTDETCNESSITPLYEPEVSAVIVQALDRSNHGN